LEEGFGEVALIAGVEIGFSAAIIFVVDPKYFCLDQLHFLTIDQKKENKFKMCMLAFKNMCNMRFIFYFLFIAMFFFAS
jgi:hypothetical protein